MAPRGRPPKFVLPERTLVVDNGADTIKAGFASKSPSVDNCHVIPNCIAKVPGSQKTWVGAQWDHCTDFAEMAFRRPVQKGYLVNWEAEREIWDQEFFDKGAKLYCDPHETNLILSEAPNGPAALQTNCDQMVFEEFEFAAYRRCTGASLNAWHDLPKLFRDPQRTEVEASPVECVLVVDAGYSHTTVTPVYKGRPINQAVRRLEIGGKFMTNYLKEMLSVRQMDVRDEVHMVNRMKEDTCYVSSDFRADMEKVRRDPLGSGIVVDYVMPDYTTRKRGEKRAHDPTTKKQMNKLGFVQKENGVHEYVVTLGNERFTVPELIFNPSDIGMPQAGLAEVIMQSLSKVPSGLWTIMLSNVLVVGGTPNLPGFAERLYAELRQIAPTECLVRVARAGGLDKATWLGGARLASNRDALKENVVTRQDYLEHGSARLSRWFAGEKGK